MIGPRLFRNRWAALLWAGGVLWTAYDVADTSSGPEAPPGAANETAGLDALGATVDANDLAILANAGGAN